MGDKETLLTRKSKSIHVNRDVSSYLNLYYFLENSWIAKTKRNVECHLNERAKVFNGHEN